VAILSNKSPTWSNNDEMSEELKENTEENKLADDEIKREEEKSGQEYKTIPLDGMYENWFLDYASYVILERAVPDINDGFKPVQRRIMHAMKDLDDGRFNKVANIIGNTMQYHPHGDASIGDAVVQMGQKDLLIETQGNWGNILTGDSSAAPRYIEARLSKFALEVVFNPKTTQWKLSYDGRKKEPTTLPVKFPLLLEQGVEGIAVGLASKILPHNFNELIDASIRILQDKTFEIFPDFTTGGLADFSKYNDGLRGGKVRVRAKITKVDKKTLAINEIPFGTTTTSLIDTIIAANDKRKIKIRKIDDNTAENVEIIIHLAPGVSPDQSIDALYAFTNCEVSISPNACVVSDGKPRFIGVEEILRTSTRNTIDLLQKELEIRKAELEEQWHFASLEKIFIEKRIYRKIEECETWEDVIDTIDKGLKPYKKLFSREITRDDIIKLTEIKIKRISKYNSLKADEIIKGVEAEIEEVKNHLDHLVDYAIAYFRAIKKKYGKTRQRRTEIRNFDVIQATEVAAATQRLYVNREEGFAGTSLRRDEFVCECSDLDDIIVFRNDGTYIVTKVAAKTFVGKDVIHIDVFKRNDDRTIYNAVYRDGRSGKAMVKRFAAVGVMRDKEYDLTKGTKNTKILYFTANPNGEAEVVKVYFRPNPKMKIKSMEFDFSSLAIKGRRSQGNILTKKPVLKIVKKEEGVSTLGALDIWYDDTVRRINTDERGTYLGAFKSDDKILTILDNGAYKLYGYDLSTHFEENMVSIMKYDPEKNLSVVYYDGESEYFYIKRFQIEETEKLVNFLNEHPETRMIAFSLDYLPMLKVVFEERPKKKPLENLEINIAEFIALKGYRAKGKRISNYPIKKVSLLDPLPNEEKETEIVDDSKAKPDQMTLEF
jgi:topoisomerase-4 subunit A